MCVCVYQSSAGDVSPHAGPLSSVPSVLPVCTLTHINICPNIHWQSYIDSPTYKRNTRTFLRAGNKKKTYEHFNPEKYQAPGMLCSSRETWKDTCIFLCRWLLVVLAPPRILSCESSAKGKSAWYLPTGLTWEQGPVCMCMLGVYGCICICKYWMDLLWPSLTEWSIQIHGKCE